MLLSHQARIVLLHFLVWSLFIIYETSVVIIMGSKAVFLDFASFYLLDILLFYCNASFLFPFAFRAKRPWIVLIPLLALQLVLYCICTVLVDIAVNSIKANQILVMIYKADYVRAIWRCIYILGLSTGYWLIIRIIENIKRQSELKSAFYQAQINPHLLFNTLNFIYNSTESVAPKASESILLLADIMRYALVEQSPDQKVDLKDEIEQIIRYVNLNQIRFNNQLHIELRISQSSQENSYRIPPLLLLTFIENIFKHGDLTDSAIPAIIEINCKENCLRFQALNKPGRGMEYEKHGIGISNVRTRLDALYKKNYSLVIENNGSIFNVNLIIIL